MGTVDRDRAIFSIKQTDIIIIILHYARKEARNNVQAHNSRKTYIQTITSFTQTEITGVYCFHSS